MSQQPTANLAGSTIVRETVRSVSIRQVSKALRELNQGRTDDAVMTLSFLVDWLEAERARERDESLTELTRLSQELPGGYR